MNMIEAPLNNANEEELMYALVPLRSGFLCQASLFDERTYPLPEVIPGEAAVIVDSDRRQDNFKRGIVTAYSYETGLHTIQIDSIETLDCYGREIRNGLQIGMSQESSPRDLSCVPQQCSTKRPLIVPVAVPVARSLTS